MTTRKTPRATQAASIAQLQKHLGLSEEDYEKIVDEISDQDRGCRDFTPALADEVIDTLIEMANSDQ